MLDEGALTVKVEQLEHRVAFQDEQIRALQAEARVAATNLGVVPIQTLGDPRVSVKKPFGLSVQRDGEDFIATWVEANISSGGDTLVEAVGNLQSLICEVFLDIVDQPFETLGRSMQKQKLVFLEMLCRTS